MRRLLTLLLLIQLVLMVSSRVRMGRIRALVPGDGVGGLVVVHHPPGQGRGVVVRNMEHLVRDLKRMGIEVRRIEEECVESYVSIQVGTDLHRFTGNVRLHSRVVIWALDCLSCSKDKIDVVTEIQLGVLTRYLTSFAVIYTYEKMQTGRWLEFWSNMDKTKGICNKTGHSLLYKAHGDLAPERLYLPLEKGPVLVLFAHNIPLIYNGAMEVDNMLTWLSETHDTDTNMVKISTRHLHRIVALEQTVLVLFFRQGVLPSIVQQSNCSARLDRLGVVAVAVERDEEPGIWIGCRDLTCTCHVQTWIANNLLRRDDRGLIGEGLLPHNVIVSNRHVDLCEEKSKLTI